MNYEEMAVNKIEMETVGKVNPEAILHKLAVYMFLHKFYFGDLVHIDTTTCEKLSNLVSEEVSFFHEEKMEKGTQLLFELTTQDLSELEFDFNRLFVGPNRLEAAPYESVYRGTERSLMQAETMAVRSFYERAGLELYKKNNNPDDHLALELEFVCYLLEESLEDDSYYALYEDFLKEHLFHWVEDHCELVREQTTNTFIMGISYILQGLLEEERKQLNVLRRLKK